MRSPIIATTDFSASADRAIDRGIALSKQVSAPLILVHAVNAAEVDADRLDSQMHSVLPEQDVEVTFAYPVGNVPTAIADFADNQKASAILMGVARHNSIGDFFLGNAVDHVIRSTSLPVLVVKRRPQMPYGKVAIATDFSSYSLEALQWIANFLPEAALHLVHSYHVPYEAWNKDPYVAEEIRSTAGKSLSQFIEKLDEGLRGRIQTHIIKSNLSSAVNDVVDQENIDLVVLGSHGESGFRHATIGSQANALLLSTKVDTAIVGPQTRD